MSIKISTDSTADIPAELQRGLNITVLPLTILTEDGRSYWDGVDLTAQACIELLENSVKLPVSVKGLGHLPERRVGADHVLRRAPKRAYAHSFVRFP